MTLRHRSRSFWIACTAGLVLLLAAGATARAQQTTGEPPVAVDVPAEDAPQPVGPIPASEIASRAAEDDTRLRELRRIAAPVTSIAGITVDLPDAVSRIETYLDSSAVENLDKASPIMLEEARSQLRRYESQLGAWSRQLDSRSQQLLESSEEVADLEAVWRLTEEDPSTSDLPDAVQQRIRSVRETLGETEELLRVRLELLLTLQNQVSQWQVAVASKFEIIVGKLGERQDQVLRTTVPPLWSTDRAMDAGQLLRIGISETWNRVKSGVREFIRMFRAQLIFHLVFFVILSLVIAVLAHRIDPETDPETGLAAARSLLQRPVAAAGLFTTVWAPVLYKDAPVVMASIIPILALPFAARLVRPLIPRERHPLLYTMLVLSLLTNLQNLIAVLGLYRQLGLVLTTLFGLVALGALRRRMKTEDPVVWPRVSRATMSVGGIFLFLTLAAAILGYVPLGELLSGGLIFSAYVAYLLLAAFRVLDALVFLALRTATARRLNGVRLHAAAIRQRITGLARLAAIVVWIWLTLERFGIWRELTDTIDSWLGATWKVGSLSLSLGTVFLFILVLWITLLVSRIVRSLLQDDLLPRANMGRGRSQMVSMLANYTILGLGFLAALAAAGIHIEQFALIGGALGVGIGFGLQNVVSNFVSGLILVFERPIQAGDTIEVGNLIGKVRRIGIRSSTVRTFDEAEVIVPNSDLISSHVVNWTLSDQMRRIEVKVGVAYGTDPVQVQELLVAVARENEKILEYPAPYALFRGFGDSSLDFVLRFWTGDFSNWIFVASETTVAVNHTLKEAGITIPFPQRDLHIYSVDPPAPLPDIGVPVSGTPTVGPPSGDAVTGTQSPDGADDSAD